MAIGDTYTSAYGNTPAGQGVQSMSDVMSSITGHPAAAALLAASGAGPNYSNTPVPQLAGNEEALRTLFAHDQALAAQYSNPNLYGGGAVPPAGNPAGFASSPLQATIESITNPGGAITPAGVTGQIGGTITGQTDALSRVLGSMDFNQTRTLDAYKTMIGALTTLANNESAKELAYVNLGYLAPDGSGNTAQDYADQFLGGMINWVDVPSNVKPAVTRIVKNSGQTVDKVQGAHTGLKNSQNILQDVLQTWTDLSPLEKLLPQALVQTIPALSPTRAKMQSLFYTTLEPELRKAAVGGRITQQEINWIRGAILPSPLDTEASAKAKVEGVLEGIKLKRMDPGYALGGEGVNAADLAVPQ